MRELVGVSYQVATAVAGLCRPAVINVDVLVAEVTETRVDKDIGCVEGNLGSRSVASALVLQRLELDPQEERFSQFMSSLTQLFHPSTGVLPSPFSRRGTTDAEAVVAAARTAMLTSERMLADASNESVKLWWLESAVTLGSPDGCGGTISR